MPIYEYTCKDCGDRRDQFNRIADRHVNAPQCCGAAMGIVPQAGLIFVQPNVCAQSPIDGTVLTSHRQRREYMARHNLVDGNDFKPKDLIAKARKKIEKRNELAAQLPQPEHIKNEVFAIP